MRSFLTRLQLEVGIVVALTLHSKLVMVLATLGLTEMLARILVVTVVLEVTADLASHGYPRARLVLRDEVLLE